MRSYTVIVIGAGAGGLVVAIGMAKAGKKVLLIEKGLYGGDCTNFGCVPSKSLIASAEAAHTLKKAADLGLEGEFRLQNAAGALERVRKVVADVRSHEDAAALAKHGIETLTATAHFVSPTEIEAGGERFTAKNFVIATGSAPLIPPISGLSDTPYLTNETIFELKEVPPRLAVLGGGPIGCELAQAFSRLGSKVSLIHRREYLLKKEEREAQELIAEAFRKEEITLYLGKEPTHVAYAKGEFTLAMGDEEIQAEHFLVSIGRTPNITELNLDAAHVHYSPKGITVDKYCRTNQKHIWAIGDVLGGPLFTHLAENQGRAVLTSLLLPLKKKPQWHLIPRVTFTDPEVASVGLLQKEAEENYGSVKTYLVPFSEVDRAVTAGRTDGLVKVVTKSLSSKILGATIVGERAGEMLPEITTAMAHNIPLRKLAGMIHAYPTYSLGIRRAGDLWLTQTFLPWLKAFSFKRFIPLFVILALMLGVYLSGVYRYISFDVLKEQHAHLKAFVSAHPIITPILFMVAYAIVTSLSLPVGAILSLIGGFLFPIPWSTLYVVVGATLGACAIFLAAKTALGDFLRKKAGPFLKKMEKGFQKNAWSYLLFLRFIPLFPFWLINIAPAFFGVPLFTYAWTTFVGIIPGAYVYTQTGAGLGAIFEAGETFSLGSVLNVQLRIALIALALFSLVPILVKKWLAKRKSKR